MYLFMIGFDRNWWLAVIHCVVYKFYNCVVRLYLLHLGTFKYPEIISLVENTAIIIKSCSVDYCVGDFVWVVKHSKQTKFLITPDAVGRLQKQVLQIPSNYSTIPTMKDNQNFPSGQLFCLLLVKRSTRQ